MIMKSDGEICNRIPKAQSSFNFSGNVQLARDLSHNNATPPLFIFLRLLQLYTVVASSKIIIVTDYGVKDKHVI